MMRAQLTIAVVGAALCAISSPAFSQDQGQAASANSSATDQRGSLVWVTLGTAGGPVPSIERGEPANLLMRRGKAHLVDVGDGAATAMVRAGSSYRDLRSIWISHIHFDHIVGL